jgi:hypothetical protein
MVSLSQPLLKGNLIYVLHWVSNEVFSSVLQGTFDEC